MHQLRIRLTAGLSLSRGQAANGIFGICEKPRLTAEDYQHLRLTSGRHP